MNAKLAAGLLLTSSFLGALSLGAPALAYTSPGSPTGYVSDFAQVLSSDTRNSLEVDLTAFAATTSNEIAVAIVPSMDGDYVENYAVKLFEEWKIGKEDRDNGVLLLLAIEEREMRIEVGYGLEGALPDSVAKRILDNEMTPLLKSGDYDGAVTAGVRSIIAATKGEYVGTDSQGTNIPIEDISGFLIFLLIAIQWLFAMLARSKSWWAGGIVGLVAGIGIAAYFALAFAFAATLAGALALFGLLLDYLISNAYKSATRGGTTPPWWTGGGGFGGGGHTGGFGGFGGGSSGGGGASGRW